MILMKKRVIIKVDDDGKYNKENKDKKIRQITQLVEALNIKNKSERLKFLYNKACDILDSDFYGKNVCQFKNNSCLQDRTKNNKFDGCCRCNNGKRHCKYLADHKCTTRCLACKFHICSNLKKLGYKYNINDILVLKYLLNWKQKIIVYLDFFKTPEEVLLDVKKNSIIYWILKKEVDVFIDDV